MNAFHNWVEHNVTLSILHGYKKPIISRFTLLDGSTKTYAFVNGLPIEYRAFCLAFCYAMSPVMVNKFMYDGCRPDTIAGYTKPQGDPFASLQQSKNIVITEEMFNDTMAVIAQIENIPDRYKMAFTSKNDLVNAIYSNVEEMFNSAKTNDNKLSFDNFCNLIQTFEEDHENQLINRPMDDQF